MVRSIANVIKDSVEMGFLATTKPSARWGSITAIMMPPVMMLLGLSHAHATPVSMEMERSVLTMMNAPALTPTVATRAQHAPMWSVHLCALVASVSKEAQQCAVTSTSAQPTNRMRAQPIVSAKILMDRTHVIAKMDFKGTASLVWMSMNVR